MPCLACTVMGSWNTNRYNVDFINQTSILLTNKDLFFSPRKGLDIGLMSRNMTLLGIYDYTIE